MPDPNNPLSYMSAEQLALMTPEDMAGLPPALAQQLANAQALRQRVGGADMGGMAIPEGLRSLTEATPQQLQQLTEMGTLDERGGLLAGQLADAQALQSRPTVQRGTLGGTIGSGLGGVVDALRGGLQERDVRSQQQALLSQKDAGRLAFAQQQADALRRRLQQVPQSAGMGDVPLLPPNVG